MLHLHILENLSERRIAYLGRRNSRFCSRLTKLSEIHQIMIPNEPFGAPKTVEFVSHCALSGTVSAVPAARLRPAARRGIMRPAAQRVV